MNEHFAKRSAPRLDAGLFDPVAEASHTLPAEWYYDPEIYRLEHEAIFYKTWWYQCHVSDIPEPGDYHAGEIADQGVFVIRGDDGEIRAFYNVCSHRAHPLVEGEGNARLIVCPYHQWCYKSDGCFRGARGKDALEGWIPDNADLKAVRVEIYGGLIFVNLDPDATPLIDQAGKLLADMRDCCPGFDDLVRVDRWEIDIAANWKTVIDNNHECYHCSVNHPALMDLVDYAAKAHWSDGGITFSHAVENKNLKSSAYQIDLENVSQESLFAFIWPTTIPLMYPGTASLCVFQVLPTGPETARERWDFYFSSHDITDEERSLIDYIKTVLVPEDSGLCAGVQKGLHSRGYRQGRFVVDRDRSDFSEHHVHFFQKFVHDALME